MWLGLGLAFGLALVVCNYAKCPVIIIMHVIVYLLLINVLSIIIVHGRTYNMCNKDTLK